MSGNLKPRNLDQPLILSAHPAGVGAIDVENPARPLPVLVGPLNLKPGDHIDLYWGDADAPVSHYEHPEEEPPINDFVTLTVDVGDIRSAPEPVPVWYRFTPFPGGTSQDSDITRLRVKLEAPGGIDIDPATPYENEALPAPPVQPPGVIVNAQGVRVIVPPYPHMSEGDRVRISWGRLSLDHPPLDSTDLEREVVIAIPASLVESAGNSSALPVRYEIHDRVGNWSKHSPANPVVVSLGSS
ncbi:hypothetical protein AB3464_25520 [Pseudomonas asplenii]|uniref:hypothetical protein n=1 Tax=Pseudomonas asplenii TaxID=53407 RepID=UPI0037C5ED76